MGSDEQTAKEEGVFISLPPQRPHIDSLSLWSVVNHQRFLSIFEVYEVVLLSITPFTKGHSIYIYIYSRVNPKVSPFSRSSQ